MDKDESEKFRTVLSLILIRNDHPLIIPENVQFLRHDLTVTLSISIELRIINRWVLAIGCTSYKGKHTFTIVLCYSTTNKSIANCSHCKTNQAQFCIVQTGENLLRISGMHQVLVDNLSSRISLCPNPHSLALFFC